MLPSISKLLDQPFWLDPSDPHRMASAMQINSRRFISQAMRRAWCWPRLCVCEDDEVTVTCSPGDPSVDMKFVIRRRTMRKSQFSEGQIIGVLREHRSAEGVRTEFAVPRGGTGGSPPAWARAPDRYACVTGPTAGAGSVLVARLRLGLPRRTAHPYPGRGRRRTRECLAAVADTAISGKRVALDRLVARHGTPATIVSVFLRLARSDCDPATDYKTPAV